MRRPWLALLIVILAAAVGYFDWQSEVVPADSFWRRPFKLGLDLRGGSHLVYEADVSALAGAEVDEAMSALRAVIERRINAFGVAEPLIQTEGSGASQRLIVELPGVTDLTEATAAIRATPLLEFRVPATIPPGIDGEAVPLDFVSSGLSGRFLKRAEVQFGQQTFGPAISLEFNAEGAKLFAAITKEHLGQPIAIFLDGLPLSAPVVREEIRDGRAEITGQFTVEEARELARNLNLGALPVPVQLISTQTVGATLGEEVLGRGIAAGLFGLAAVGLFLLLWYRLPGLLAVVALAIYLSLMLAIFKLLPVTITAAGIAGFILSLGIAVDANILIFERLKEELRRGAGMIEAIQQGFARAWLSIRDSNLSSLLSAGVLFWFGTSFIKGFALTLSLGIIVSMFTAIVVTRTLLLTIAPSGGVAPRWFFRH